MRAKPADPESIPQLELRHDGAAVIVVLLIVSALPYLLGLIVRDGASAPPHHEGFMTQQD
jgi:hypothetical protein